MKFRDFKKTWSIDKVLSHPQNLFYKIASDIFKASLDEPNGILGACIHIKFLYENKTIDLCRFLYDPCTLTTFEVTFVIGENVNSMKKILQAFKLYISLGKHLNVYLHENNYEFLKKKMY